MANRYFAAVGAGDIDTAMGLLSPDVAIERVRPVEPEDYEMLLTWDAEDDPQYLDVECIRACQPAGSRSSAPTACTLA